MERRSSPRLGLVLTVVSGWLALSTTACRLPDAEVAYAPHVNIKGIQSGWVLDEGSDHGPGYQTAFERYPEVLNTIERLGAGWYRFEFRVPPRSLRAAGRRRESLGLEPDCGTNCSPEDLGWDEELLSAYDRALDELVGRNIKVLGLISNATIAAPQSRWIENSSEMSGGDGDNPAIDNLGSVVFLLLLERFADRIQTWEIANEPDVWTNNHAFELTAEDLASGQVPGGSFMYPSNFAQLLAKAFYAARAAEEKGAGSITIVSGGLLAMNSWKDDRSQALREEALFHNVSGSYLYAFVDAGVRHAGWTEIIARHGRLPIDGWGLHLYVSQQQQNISADPWSNFGRYIAAFQDMTRALSTRHLRVRRRLPVWVTEIGFATQMSTVPQTQQDASPRGLHWSRQAKALELAYRCLNQLNPGTPAFWFTLFDIPHEQIMSGLFTPVWGTPDFAPLTEKPAAHTYHELQPAPRALHDCRQSGSAGARTRGVRCEVIRRPLAQTRGDPFSGKCRDW